MEPNYTAVRFMPMAEGRFLDDADVAERRRVVVLGFKATALVHRAADAGRDDHHQRTCVYGGWIGGARSAAATTTGDDQKVYIPITTMQELFAMKGDNIPQDALTSIQYQPTTKGDATAAIAAVHRVIAERHGFDPSHEGRV